MYDLQVSIQTTHGEWWTGDSHEAADEDAVAVQRLIADTLTAKNGYVSINVGAKTRYFPVRSVIQVEVDVRQLDT